MSETPLPSEPVEVAPEEPKFESHDAEEVEVLEEPDFQFEESENG